MTAEAIGMEFGHYHGFHDAEILSVTICPLRDDSGELNVEAELRARNYTQNTVDTVKLIFQKVRRMRISYDQSVDYPNIRDEISVGFFDNLAYIDFGSACEPQGNPEAYLSAESYFVCESVWKEVVSKPS